MLRRHRRPAREPALSRPHIHVPGRADADAPHHVAVLRIHDPHGREELLVVDRPVLHIGSDRGECGLVLAGTGIATNHCSLRWSGRRWLLHDRGAPAGTYINDRRCREPTALCTGDRIAVVHHRVEFSTLPSLALPHVLARLRDRPIAWQAPAPAPSADTDPPPRSVLLAASRVALLAAVAALLATLAVLFTPLARPADPTPTNLSPGTSPPLPASTLADIPRPADLSPGTSPNDLSIRPSPPPSSTLADIPRPTDLSPGTSPTDLSLRPSPPLPTSTLAYLTEPPAYELPLDAIGLGRPTDGALINALQLPTSPDYTIRCPALAHGTTATIGELMRALGSVRNRGYRGELVVGDLSRADGGQYGPHKSHQSGRDVDLWLPIRGGRYARGCPRCATDLCRPEPGAVDWPATWRLIEALAERGAVEDIFLDWTLHPDLLHAARELGVPDEVIARTIQFPVRGRGSLIKHSDGHVHHIHVRFREPPPA